MSLSRLCNDILIDLYSYASDVLRRPCRECERRLDHNKGRLIFPRTTSVCLILFFGLFLFYVLLLVLVRLVVVYFKRSQELEGERGDE